MGTESRSISESTYVKNTWIAAPMQRMPNTVDSFHLMFGEARRHEQAEGEVEQPVADGGDRLRKSVY
jgi:hypothetical protein